MEHKFEKQLDEIREHIIQQALLQKTIFNLSEAAAYAGISKSYLYKLTSTRQITFYRPVTKLIFFKRTELDDWLLQNKLSTIMEMANFSSATQGITNYKTKSNGKR